MLLQHNRATDEFLDAKGGYCALSPEPRALSTETGEDVVEKATADTVARFAAFLYRPDDLVEVRNILPDRRRVSPRQRWYTADKLSSPIAIRWMMSMNARGWGVYFGVGPRTSRGGGSAEHVRHAPALFVDFDPREKAGVVTVEEVLGIIRERDLPEPSGVVSSGRGVHCYWKLRAPLCDLEEFRGRQAALIETLGSDDKIKDPSRVMRTPGFLNTRTLPRRPVEIISLRPELTYTLGQLPPPIYEKVEKGAESRSRSVTSSRPKSRPKTCPPPSREKSQQERAMAEAMVGTTAVVAAIEATLPRGPGQRHLGLFRFVTKLRQLPGLSDVSPWSLRPVVEEWVSGLAAMEYVKNKDIEFNLLEFVDAWERYDPARRPDFVADAVAWAKQQPLPDPDELSDITTDGPRLLLSVFRRMAEASEDGLSFWASTRELAVPMGVSHTMVRQYIKHLVRRGLVVVTKPHVYGGKDPVTGKRIDRSAEYRLVPPSTSESK